MTQYEGRKSSRHLLMISAVSAMALSSGSALASIDFAHNHSTYCKPGFYAGIEGGRSKTHYSPGNVLAPAAANENYQADAYPYSPPGLGTPYEPSVTSSSALNQMESDDIGMGGRIFAGYQFMPYFAAEIGATQYGKTTFSATGEHSTSVLFGNVGTACFPCGLNSTYYDKYKGEVTEHSVDLVAKGTLPLQYGFGAYVKAGAAYITARRTLNETSGTSQTFSTPYDSIVTTFTPALGGSKESNISTQNYQAVRPVYGAGLDYTLPDTPFDLDISWTRVQGIGSGIPNADLLAAGLGYKFG